MTSVGLTKKNKNGSNSNSNSNSDSNSGSNRNSDSNCRSRNQALDGVAEEENQDEYVDGEDEDEQEQEVTFVTGQTIHMVLTEVMRALPARPGPALTSVVTAVMARSDGARAAVTPNRRSHVDAVNASHVDARVDAYPAFLLAALCFCVLSRIEFASWVTLHALFLHRPCARRPARSCR